jgi:ATP-dependent helicase/nuclease subunit A
MAPARRVLTPSAAFDAGSVPGTFAGAAALGAGDRRLALARGHIVHRLLQSLPAIDVAQRDAAARRFCASIKPALPPAMIDAMIAEVAGVLAQPAFAPLFAPGTRAEVPIVGRITDAAGETIAISGQVDRLAVTADAVLIGDFKTDRLVPASSADVPERYRRQLALYRKVLARLYPDRPVRAALVFTQAPVLIELPACLLDAALTRYGTAVP